MPELTRVARTQPMTLTHTFDIGETATPATGDVTVTVTDPAGAVVLSGTATPAGDAYTMVLPGQPQLTMLQAAWSATVVGAARVDLEQVEVVGAHLFSLRAGRDSDDALKDTERFPTIDLINTRLAVELECEWICGQAFTPHYRRIIVDGAGSRDIVLPDGSDEIRGGYLMRGVRTIRAAATRTRVGLPWVDLDADDLAALTVRAGGVLRRTDGQMWPAGDSNVRIEYEYGSDAPPPDLVTGAFVRLRSRLLINKTQIPDRAISYTVEAGGTYRLSLPDAFRTGIPEVDAAYGRYSRRVSPSEAPGGRPVPASRTLTYDPQHQSMFHGGRW